MNCKLKQFFFEYKGEKVTLNYSSWGENHLKTIFCVHGLTRNCRDFDYLADKLSDSYHVICLDLPGRGLSGWLQNYQLYQYQTYIDSIYKLLDHYQITSLDWIGSSLGGILGMKIASERKNLINKLVLNDIGPFVPFKALSKISTYVDKYPLFQNLLEAEEYLKKIIPNFGIRYSQDWEYITQNSFILGENNLYHQAYDPKLVKAFIKDHFDNIELWNEWNQMQAEILVIRGEKSNILLRDTAITMSTKKNVSFYELQDVGHTPSLMNAEEISLIENWLLKT